MRFYLAFFLLLKPSIKRTPDRIDNSSIGLRPQGCDVAMARTFIQEMKFEK